MATETESKSEMQTNYPLDMDSLEGRIADTPQNYGMQGTIRRDQIIRATAIATHTAVCHRKRKVAVQASRDRLACVAEVECRHPRLLLCTEAPLMMPDGIDFFFSFLECRLTCAGIECKVAGRAAKGGRPRPPL